MRSWIPRGLISYFRFWIYRVSYYGRNVEQGAIVGGNSTLGRAVKIYSNAVVLHSSIGRFSYVGQHARITATRVGDFCSIAPGAIIGGGRHPTDFVSTSPVFYSTLRQCGTSFVEADAFNEWVETTIDPDVWIGYNAIILPGIHVGLGAIVGAGAVVTRDVPAYAIVVGIPARIIRYRFPEDVRRRLEQSRWWTADEQVLSDNAAKMKILSAFLAWRNV